LIDCISTTVIIDTSTTIVFRDVVSNYYCISWCSIQLLLYFVMQCPTNIVLRVAVSN